MSQEQKLFKNLVHLMNEDKLDEFKAAVGSNPAIIYFKNAKDNFLYQIACLYDKLDFVKFMDEESINKLETTIDAEVPFCFIFFFFT